MSQCLYVAAGRTLCDARVRDEAPGPFFSSTGVATFNESGVSSEVHVCFGTLTDTIVGTNENGEFYRRSLILFLLRGRGYAIDPMLHRFEQTDRDSRA